jgi:hypothetical protein
VEEVSPVFHHRLDICHLSRSGNQRCGALLEAVGSNHDVAFTTSIEVSAIFTTDQSLVVKASAGPSSTVCKLASERSRLQPLQVSGHASVPAKHNEYEGFSP